MIDGDKLAKLPQWAQRHIEELRRDRDAAVRRLGELQEDNAESGEAWHKHTWYQRYYDTASVSGERYINAHDLTLKCAGVNLTIAPGDAGISLYFSAEGRDCDVAIMPRAANSILLQRRRQP